MKRLAKNPAARAVVFAYHDIGVRCLEALLDLGLDIPLVVTHPDNEFENIWFASVAELAGKNGLPCITPSNVNGPEVLAQVSDAEPDFLFSFYYRTMLGEDMLRTPCKGAFNLHGSLLPRYRGRVPVNWAIINGERETGVSLHRMVIKPDAGPLVAQQSVPILANDTALDVFRKLVCAAERVILQAVPGLIDGSAQETPQDLRTGDYFGGRRPEDGRIDWGRSAWEIHNLIRAVAPPYPGAFFDVGGQRIFVLGSYYRDLPARSATPCLYWRNGMVWADCIDGQRLLITELRTEGSIVHQQRFRSLFGDTLLLAPQANKAG
jgi:methionyl-tRNA formyltransferase